MNETAVVRDAFKAGSIFAMDYLGEQVPVHRIEEQFDIWLSRFIRDRETEEFGE